MLKIRRPLGRLIFNMGIAIPGKTVFLIETAPRWAPCWPHEPCYLGLYWQEESVWIVIVTLPEQNTTCNLHNFFHQILFASFWYKLCYDTGYLHDSHCFIMANIMYLQFPSFYFCIFSYISHLHKGVSFLSISEKKTGTILIYYELLRPYGDIDQVQHWFR